MRIASVTYYAFDELSDAAKESARTWFRSFMESDDLANYEDWEAVAAILGITFDRRKRGVATSDPCVWWSGFCSQGDGASFEGRYAYAKGAAKRIREYAPTDAALHAIADALQSAQRRAFYRLEAHVSRGAGSHYAHSGTMSVDVQDRDDSYRDIGDLEDGVRDALRSFADWIYGQLRAQDEYLNSDEAVDESIRANEYEFAEDGEFV